ncbi:MAG: HAD family phosphatase [Verrucomicrobia bacterium]|nr:HAD family phosphatase [Kiritimatiellia bacterium]MCP5487915.1 HAD family phosphatase [Verrucomicrobiota bacterium]
MLDAFLFDFDGVIVDTEPLHHRAFQRVLDPLGLPISWEEYQRRYIGFDDRDALRERFQAGGEPLSHSRMKALIHRKAQAFLEIIRTEGAQPYPGLVELIRSTSAHRPTALCSGALLSDVQPILAQLGLDQCFQVKVTADRVASSKPDPESYQLAFTELEKAFPGKVLRLTHSLAIEDTPAGIRSARAAGLKVLAVTNTYPAKDLQEAHRVVTTLDGMTAQDLDHLMDD